MAKVILHIGAHKTASTHLQNNININREYLEQQGIIYFRFHEITGLREEAVKLRNKVGKRENFEKEYDFIKSKIEEKVHNYDYAIVSYEGTLGNLSLNTDVSKSIYPDASRLLNLYAKMLHKHEVTIAFAIRNYADFIYSTYKYRLERGLSIRLSRYLIRFNWKDRQPWTRIINSINENFEKQIFWTQEVYEDKASDILCWLLTELNNEIDCTQLKFNNKKIYKSAKKDVLNTFQLTNKILGNRITSKILTLLTKKSRKEQILFITQINQSYKNNLIMQRIGSGLPQVLDVNKNEINAHYDYEAELKYLKDKFNFFST